MSCGVHDVWLLGIVYTYSARPAEPAGWFLVSPSAARARWGVATVGEV